MDPQTHPPASCFYLFRHGEVEGAGQALCGHTDVPLSSNGWQQMRAQAEFFPPLDQVISSPLIRCADFARELAASHSVSCAVQPGFQECDFGDWDGVPFAAMSDQWAALEAFWASPATVTPPSGEALKEMFQRVQSHWLDLLSEWQGKTLVLVTHGGVIRIILALILQLDWKNPRLYSQLKIPYASVCQITQGSHSGSVPVVETIGWSREAMNEG